MRSRRVCVRALLSRASGLHPLPIGTPALLGRHLLPPFFSPLQGPAPPHWVSPTACAVLGCLGGLLGRADVPGVVLVRGR